MDDTETKDQALKVFFEIHDDIPRGGPGDFESTRKAFLMLKDLPKKPMILDIGCGPGMQTLDLARITEGKIVALDNHQPFLDRLQQAVNRYNLTNRIAVVNGDMTSLDFDPGSFKVVWAEGSIYIMGFKKALNAWKPLLTSPGYLAVTEVSWLKPDPPEELGIYWTEQYPAMQDVEANLKDCRESGYKPLGNFTLPESAWWDNYYTPIEEKLHFLRKKYRTKPEAMAVLDIEAKEIEMYRKYADYYGYVFYIVQAD